MYHILIKKITKSKTHWTRHTVEISIVCFDLIVSVASIWPSPERMSFSRKLKCVLSIASVNANQCWVINVKGMSKNKF